MCCDGKEEALALYAGGELPETEHVAFETHVKACGACRAYVEELAALRGTLGEFSELPADDLMLNVLSARIRAATAQTSRQRVTLRRMLLAGGLAACAVVAFMVTLARDRSATSVSADKKFEFAINTVADGPVSTSEDSAPAQPKMDRVLAKIQTGNPNVVIILLASDNDKDESHASDASAL